MRCARRLSRTLLAVVVVALLVPAVAAARPVPRDWLGVSFGPDYVAAHAKLADELGRMKRSGVGTARFALYWFQVQPYAKMADVPRKRRKEFRVVGGIPTDFRALDRLAAAAAKNRLALMPVLLGAPRWATDDVNRPVYVPRDPADFARFASTLVHRYGARGTYWKSHKRVHRFPIHTWQVWNEVSNPWYWDSGWATGYPVLLRRAYDAIKAADGTARVVEAGLNTGGAGAMGAQTSWNSLDTLYHQLDAQGLARPFDEVAVHIYTSQVADAVKVVQETRKVMDRHGDVSRPIRVTELAWPAARGRLRDEQGHRREFFAATSDRGMAKRLSQGVVALAAQRLVLRISGVDWFQWASSYKGTSDAFSYSGLRIAAHSRLKDRPAMAAYRRVAKRLRR